MMITIKERWYHSWFHCFYNPFTNKCIQCDQPERLPLWQQNGKQAWIKRKDNL